MRWLREDDSAESSALQLPVQGLYADLEAGVGSVRLSDEFTACSNALQIEVLDDWLAALAGYRLRALQRLYHELCTGLPDMSPSEKLARFHATCEAMGIQVPADFDVPMLKR
jgi:hypothetical protein